MHDPCCIGKKMEEELPLVVSGYTSKVLLCTKLSLSHASETLTAEEKDEILNEVQCWNVVSSMTAIGVKK